MPFHTHHQQNAVPNPPPGAAAGIYQAAQTLGSIGAPAGNLRLSTSGTTAVGTDALLPGSGNAPGLGVHGAGGQSAPPTVSGLPGPGASTPSSASQQQFETPRRPGTLGRTPEELHISAGTNPISQQNPAQPHQQAPSQPPPQQQLFDSPQQYSAGATPNISLQQATPQSSHYANPQSSSAAAVPGSLQPGNAQRPGPSSAYSAPSGVPSVPQINTNAQQYTLPTRSNTMNTSHTYSRSSPAGLEQKYIPFSNTPENAKYSSTPSQKYYTPQTPSGPASSSPLALADIRPRGNSGVDESIGGGSMAPDFDKQPTNSNYLAPWGVYAYDWCKWPLHSGNNAGKMAVGSYLEDAHNFVSDCKPFCSVIYRSNAKIRFKSWTRK
jgi:DDB1- and CUL4-associated factor 7